MLAVFVFSYCQTKVGKIGDPKTNHLRLVLPGNANSQVPVWSTTDSKYHPSFQGSNAGLNPKDYGAKMDYRRVTDGVMSASSTTLTSATANFTQADVGKTIGVMGAGTLPLRANNTDYPQYKAFTIADGVGNVWWFWVSSCIGTWTGSPPVCSDGGTTGSSPPVPVNLTATDVTVSAAGNVYTYTTVGSIDFSVYHPGWLVNVGGFATAGNLGQKTVISATATVLTVADAGESAEASGPTATFTGIPGPGETITDGTATLTNGGRVYPFWAAGLPSGILNIPWAMVRIGSTDTLMHMTSVGTTAFRPPNWAVTCPNLNDTCADGAATWTNAGPFNIPPLITTIASVSNATTAILTAPSVNAVTGAYVHIATDDTVAMRATVTAAAVGNSGLITMPQGTLVTTDTITMGGLTANALQCVSIDGKGAGGTLQNTNPGSIFLYMGTVGVPILQVQNCPKVKISNIRLSSLGGNAPAAGVNFTARSGPGVGAGMDILDNLTIGNPPTAGGGNGDTGWSLNTSVSESARQFLNGILLDGNNGNNDRMHFSHIYASQSGIGIYSPNSQAVEEQLTSSQLNFGEEAVDLQGQWALTNIEMNGNYNTNIRINNSAKVMCDQCSSEGSLRDVVFGQGAGAGGGSFIRKGGSYLTAELADHVPWDSTEIFPYDMRTSGVAMQWTGNFIPNSTFSRTDLPYPSGFYDGYVVPIGTNQGSCTSGTFIVDGGSAIHTDQIMDASSTTCPHAIVICPGGSSFNNNCSSNLLGTTQGGTLNLAFRDQATIRAGGIQTVNVARPGTPALSVKGTASTHSYYYEVTAVTNGGETIPSNESAQITNAPVLSIAAGNGVKICFAQSLMADGYNIYRTADAGGSGTEQLITPVSIPADSNAFTACALGQAGWIDYGLNAPSGALPTVGKVGNIISSGVVQTTGVTIANLPTCNSAAAGSYKSVTNATACVDGVAPVGTGAVNCPVYCDGTSWKALYLFPTPTPSPTPTPTKTPTPTPTP